MRAYGSVGDAHARDDDLVAAAALAAAPATAQNNAADANGDVAANAAVSDANTVACERGKCERHGGDPAANADMTAPPDETAPAPARARSQDRGFPWGVIGLVGLVGLLGRSRRD